MRSALTTVGTLYLAIALIWLGIQIPIGLATCAEAADCAGSLVAAPFLALAWPIYGPWSNLLPPLVLQALFFLTVPLAAALFLVGAWSEWAHAHLGNPSLRR